MDHIPIGQYFYIIICGLFGIIGLFGNVLTFTMLRHMHKSHGKKSSSSSSPSFDITTRWLLQSQAIGDSVANFLLLIAVTNRVFDDVWPFNLPGVCHYVTAMFNFQVLGNVHSIAVAILRFIAVYCPGVSFIRRNPKTYTIVLLTFIWLYVPVLTLVGMVAKIFTAEPSRNGAGCMSYVPYDGRSGDDVDFVVYSTIMVGVNVCFLPIVGTVLYLAIIFRTRRNHQRALHGRRVGPAAAVSGQKNTPTPAPSSIIQVCKVISLGVRLDEPPPRSDNSQLLSGSNIHCSLSVPVDRHESANLVVVPTRRISTLFTTAWKNAKQTPRPSIQTTSTYDRQYHALKAVVAAQVVSLILQIMWPIDAIISSGDLDAAGKRWDMIIFDIISNVAYGVNPIVYAVASLEMRHAYVNVLKSGWRYMTSRCCCWFGCS